MTSAAPPAPVPSGAEFAFGGVTIRYDERVLQPRPWTLAQARWGAELLRDLPAGPVLELCSGAGHIGLLTVRSSGRRLVMVDASEAAVAISRGNADEAGMGDRVEVRCGRLQEVVAPGERFPLIQADPPWVPHLEISRFPEDPVTAIDGGDDGLDVARACLQVIDAHLLDGGTALLQLGTVEQVDLLREELPILAPRLSAHELRFYGTSGVVLRLDA